MATILRHATQRGSTCVEEARVVHELVGLFRWCSDNRFHVGDGAAEENTGTRVEAISYSDDCRNSNRISIEFLF